MWSRCYIWTLAQRSYLTGSYKDLANDHCIWNPISCLLIIFEHPFSKGPSPSTVKLREGSLTALVLTRPAHLSRTRTFIRNKSRGQSASFKSLSRSSRQHHGHSRPASTASAVLLSGQTRKVNINTHITAFSHLLSL